MSEDTKLITITQAAELAGVDVATVRRAAKKQTLKARKVGNTWVTTPADVKTWKATPEYHKPGRKMSPKD